MSDGIPQAFRDDPAGYMRAYRLKNAPPPPLVRIARPAPVLALVNDDTKAKRGKARKIRIPGRVIYEHPIGPAKWVFVAPELDMSDTSTWPIHLLTPENIKAGMLVPPMKIAAWVGMKHNLPRNILFGHTRAWPAVRARHEFMGLCRRHTPLSTTAIARVCRVGDHTTVMHGARQFEKWVAAGQIVPWSQEQCTAPYYAGAGGAAPCL